MNVKLTNTISNKGLTISVLMICNLLVKVFGLLREIALAYFYGTSIYTDAYVIANNIPTTLFSSLGAAIATTFVPIYTKIEIENSKKKANEFTVVLGVILLAICLGISFLGIIFSKQFVRLFASGFSGESLNITTEYTQILFPSIIGMVLMQIFGAYLQCKGKITPIAIVPMISNITIIIALFISYYLNNIYIFVWGTLCGILLQVVFYLPWVVKLGLFKSLNSSIWRDSKIKAYIKMIIALIIPVFCGGAVNEINTIVDRSLVSGLSSGVVSSLNYAYKIINMLYGVVIASLMTIVYPELSKMAVDGNNKDFGRYCQKNCILILTVMGLITVILLPSSETIVKVILGHGSFDADSIEMTSVALLCYGIGLIGMGEREIIAKVMYSFQNTKTPMYNGIFCAALNIILDILMIHYWGYLGAALATSIVTIISALNLYRCAKKKGYFCFEHIWMPVFKICIGLGIVAVFMETTKEMILAHIRYGIFFIIVWGLICIIASLLFLVTQFILRNNYLIDMLKACIGRKR